MTVDTKPVRSDAERLQIFQQRLSESFALVPFNKVIGGKVVSISNDEVVMSFEMRPELVGNVFKRILHGGVIATALDSVGGLASFNAVYQKLQSNDRDERNQRLAQIGTIDMRVDYIRPGRGESFLVTGKVVRLGSKICATQMTLHNEQNDLIATGNAVFHY